MHKQGIDMSRDSCINYILENKKKFAMFGGHLGFCVFSMYLGVQGFIKIVINGIFSTR